MTMKSEEGGWQFLIPNSSFMRCHHPPGDEALVHCPQPPAEEAAEEIEELDRGIRVHRQHLLEQ